MTILEAKELKKYYGSGDTLVKALDGVDLAVAQGEFVSMRRNVGKWKVNIASYARRFRCADSRSGHCRWKKYFYTETRRTDNFSKKKDWICISELQPCSGAKRL